MKNEFKNFKMKSRMIDNNNNNIIVEANAVIQEEYNQLFDLGEQMWSSDLCNRYEIVVFNERNELVMKIRLDLFNFVENIFKNTFLNQLNKYIKSFNSLVQYKKDMSDYQDNVWNKIINLDTTITYNIKESFFIDKYVFNKVGEILDICNFKLVYDNKTNEYSLIDKMGANNADIESDRFANIIDVIDRLDVYIHDAFYSDLVEIIREENRNISLPSTYDAMSDLAYKMINNKEISDMYKIDADVLKFVSTIHKYENILNDKGKIFEYLFDKTIEDELDNEINNEIEELEI